jgi:hypothetical protein
MKAEEDKMKLEDGVVDELQPSSTTANKQKKKKKKKSANGAAASAQFPLHPERCKLIALGSNLKGRALLAKTTIEPGKCFFSEKGLCVISSTKGLCCLCHRILGSGNGSATADEINVTCSSPECVNAAETAFATERTAYGDIEDIAQRHNCDPRLLLAVIRLYMLKHNRGNDASSSTSDVAFADNGTTIKATLHGMLLLEDHLHQQNAAWKTSLCGALEELYQSLKGQIEAGGSPVSSVKEEVDFMLAIAAKINVNSYGIVDPANNKPLGFGLFPAVGVCVNHDCNPNAFFCFGSAGTMDYRTISTVKQGDELCVSYVDVLEGTPARRQYLLDNRFFLCMCGRCTGYDKAVRCVLQSQSLHLLAEDALLDSFGETGTESNNNGAFDIQTILNDSALSGIYCRECGPTGVIIAADERSIELLPQDRVSVAPSSSKDKKKKASTSNSSSSAMSPKAACLVCCKELDVQEAVAYLADAQYDWKVCAESMRSISSSGEGSGAAALNATALATIESWLQKHDPLFTPTGAFLPYSSAPTGGTKSVSKIASVARRRKTPLQLHPQHSLMIEALIALVNRLSFDMQSEAKTSADLERAIDALKRAYEAMKKVLPENHPELATVALMLADLLSKSHAKRSGVLNATNLMNTAVCARRISLGDLHPLTTEARRKMDGM